MAKTIEDRAHALADELIALQQAIILELSDGGSECKANYNSNQPRIPRGRRWGGRWTRTGGDGGDAPAPLRHRQAPHIDIPDWSDIEVGFRDASRQVQQFLARNQDSITRILGGLQAVGGAAEVFAGVAAVGGGVATSEVGVGIAIAGAGGWMVANGYDNYTTGWRALLTGSPQETNLHFTLRQLGLSDEEATATEILLAGGASVAAARLSREALEQAAQAGLAQRAVAAFSTQPLKVRAGALRIWDEPNITTRGLAWEAFDADRTGIRRTPPGFEVIDQFDRDSGLAISNKTLDLVTPPYSRVGPNPVLNRISTYIDELAAFQRDNVNNFEIVRSQIRERRLHLLLPANEALAGQAVQIAAAERYALTRGVVLQVEYAR